MAEEFQAGICGENWWSIDSTRSVFPLSSSSSCSVAASDAGNCTSTWQTDLMGLKATSRSCGEETNNLVSDSYLGFPDAQKPHKSESDSGSGGILIDSSLQMMGYGLSSSTSANWDPSLL